MTFDKQAEVTQADHDAANKAFDIAFRGETDGIDDAMAELFAKHRLAAREASSRQEERLREAVMLEVEKLRTADSSWAVGIRTRLRAALEPPHAKEQG